MRSGTRDAIGALAVQALAVVWLTWPLGHHLATHVPDTVYLCRLDARLLAVVLAHESRALLGAPSTLADLGVYHPSPHTLFYGEAAFGALPYFLPPFLASGNPALALNVTLLVSLMLTAAALHMVVVRWSGSHAGGAVAGFVFLTSRWVHWTWVPAAPNYAVLQYLPVVIFLAADRAPGRRKLVALLGLVVLQGLSSVYLAAATLAPLLLLGLARAVRAGTRRAGLGLLVALAGAMLVLLAAYSGYFRVRGENPALQLQTIWQLRPFQGGMVLPRDLVDPRVPTSVPSTIFLLILVGAASLLLAGWRRRDERMRQGWRHAAFWTLTGLFIALTPVVHLDLGMVEFRAIELPHEILARWTPVYEIVRERHRLAVAALMGLALLGGLSVAELSRRVAGPLPAWIARSIVAVGALCVAAVIYVPVRQKVHFDPTRPRSSAYPLMRADDAPFPDLMPTLREPGGPLLEVSLPVPSQPMVRAAQNAAAMYRAIDHRRRLLNGYSGYWPADFTERAALIGRLPDPAALRALRERTGVALILVRDDSATDEFRKGCEFLASANVHLEECHPEGMARVRAPWLRAAEGRRDDLRLVARDGADLLFEVVSRRAFTRASAPTG